MHLGLWNSIAIVLGFSFLVVGLDEYVAKPWRHRRLEARAKAGDKGVATRGVTAGVGGGDRSH